MKINLTERVTKDRSDFLMHMIFSSLSKTAYKELAASRGKDGIVADVRFTVNEHEIDIELFCKHLQSQVHRIIKEEAVELAKEKLSNINNLLSELEEKLSEEIDKRLEDWEKWKKEEKKK